MTEEEQIQQEDDDYAAWAHQYDQETQRLMDEQDWDEMQLQITLHYEDTKNELQNRWAEFMKDGLATVS